MCGFVLNFVVVLMVPINRLGKDPRFKIPMWTLLVQNPYVGSFCACHGMLHKKMALSRKNTTFSICSSSHGLRGLLRSLMGGVEGDMCPPILLPALISSLYLALLGDISGGHPWGRCLFILVFFSGCLPLFLYTLLVLFDLGHTDL